MNAFARLRVAALVALALIVMAGPAVFVAMRAQQGSAAFADDEEIGINEITAARLDVDLGPNTVPIVGTNLAPGDVRSGSIEIANQGTIDLRYSVSGASVAAASRELANWLTWTAFYSDDGRTCGPPPPSAVTIAGTGLAAAAPLIGDPAAGADPDDRVLRVGERELLCLQATLSLDAPNSVQATTVIQPFVVDAEQAEQPDSFSSTADGNGLGDAPTSSGGVEGP